MSAIFTELVRWVFIVLAVYILVRCIRSLLKTKNPAEVWAYLHMEILRPLADGRYEQEEISLPLTHWENVIGRANSCDVVSGDTTISRNHGILMRDMGGNWIFQDLGSRNGSYINEEKVEELTFLSRWITAIGFVWV